MDCVPPSWTSFMVFSLLLVKVSAETVEVRQALVQFLDNIYPANAGRDASWGWNLSSDPCDARWKGVDCRGTSSVRKIVLNEINLTGILDASSLCVTRSLAVLSLNDNNVFGNLPEEISNCSRLTHLYLSGNNFTGNLPKSLSRLNNLKRIDISNNRFSGALPDLSRISGLLSFLAENNQLSGEIPDFDFSNLAKFNVSYNNFSGPVPNEDGHFGPSSFLGNPELCGQPLSIACPTPPPVPAPTPAKKKHSSSKQYLIYSGYAILALIIIFLVGCKVFKRKKHGAKNSMAAENESSKPSSTSSDSKIREGSRSEFSIMSPATRKSSSLVVLSSPMVNGMQFEDLLRAPAELVGRGKHGTLYKVALNNSVTLAVKRIKDWEISRDDFKKRMQKINEVKHANVLPIVAYYCSEQEKLLVYEFQQDGSLFRLLNENQKSEMFDWGSRLNVAASTANALALMHQELHNDGIAHGNLKSSNILMNKDMDPCISEYGLKMLENHDEQFTTQIESIMDSDSQGSKKIFKADIYSFGVILLELLTGKLVQNRASDLAKWVHSVVREEWTAEVFDKALISEGASEERMVNLLQVALRCINPSLDARPSSSQVAVMINSIKGDEEKSTNTSIEL
ncbi:probable inactive receptor kinase At2g26730 [Coffea arabica]|uniref:Probable inactive receptor kinase At2g26730 n=1 Tax=Coffea arabica TaxID=13443 RepID=A0A6P6XFV3_COFAR